MITNTGKGIIAKYLVGQTPVYASYMSMGCGSLPLSTSVEQPNYADKTSMDFEMFRVPITSRGYIKESVTADITGATYSTGTVTYTANNSFIPGDRVTISGVTPTAYNLVDEIVETATDTQFTVSYTGSFGSYSTGGLATATRSRIVLTAELPTEQRYEISEIGIYSAKSNPSAVNRDSRMLYSFLENEDWEYHDSSVSGSLGNTVTIPLYGSSNDGIIKPTDPVLAPLIQYPKAFRVSTDNSIFNSASRIEKYENCRFLNGIVMLAGNLSVLDIVDNKVDVKDRSTSYATNGTHIHLQGSNLNLSRQSSEDELRLAFSIVNKDASATTLHPSRVLIMVELSSEDSAAPTNYAKFEIDSDSIGGFSPSTNRYYVAKTKISELTKGPNFAWNSISIVKIYVSIFKTGSSNPTDDFYLCLDAMRLENVTTQNPLYGLVGYAVTRTDNSQPILKASNTSNSVEFRYGLDVI